MERRELRAKQMKKHLKMMGIALIVLGTRLSDLAGVDPDPTVKETPDLSPTHEYQHASGSDLIKFTHIYFNIKVIEILLLKLFLN